MEEFSALGLSPELEKAVLRLGFEHPTEIQAKSIPAALAGKDIIATSATGSGKTLAFGAVILQKMVHSPGIHSPGIKALILTPTRELAVQIQQAFHDFSRERPVKVALVFGGVSIEPQIHELRSADIVVATPGRLLDHLERGTVSLAHVRYLVLDEADRMLDMGFFDDVRKIISQCPYQRQTMLFSATMPPEVIELSQRFLKDPVKVKAEVYVDPTKLTHYYYDVDSHMKLSLLVHLLKKEHPGLVMVFCNSRDATNYVEKALKLSGIDAVAIHGGLSQNRRLSIIERFHNKNTFVLVCTDVAARGLDIPGVSHVYNYDLPSDSKQYMHRVGRTARAGESGKAVNLLSRRDHDNFSRILRDYSVNIEKLVVPEVKRVYVPRAREKARYPKRRNRRERGRFPQRESSPKSRFGQRRFGPKR